MQWQIQGRGPGDPAPPLFLDQTETRRAEKYFFGDRPSSLNFIRLLRVVITPYRPALSQGLDDRPPPPPPLPEGLDQPLRCSPHPGVYENLNGTETRTCASLSTRLINVVNLTQGFMRILTVQKLESVQACQPGL